MPPIDRPPLLRPCISDLRRPCQTRWLALAHALLIGAPGTHLLEPTRFGASDSYNTSMGRVFMGLERDFTFGVGINLML